MSFAQRVEENPVVVDEAQLMLKTFGGNALAALQSVIDDAEFLCEQLETASLYRIAGSARGWKPKLSAMRDVKTAIVISMRS